MRFVDYLRGQRFALDSERPPEEVARRLDAGMGRMWMPFETGVVGWRWFNRFGLLYFRSAWFRRQWLPVLVGRIEAHSSGSRIIMSYRAPRLLLALFVGWTYLVVLYVRNAGLRVPLFVAPLFLGSAALLLGVFGLSAILSEADEDLPEMLAMVEQAAA